MLPFLFVKAFLTLLAGADSPTGPVPVGGEVWQLARGVPRATVLRPPPEARAKNGGCRTKGVCSSQTHFDRHRTGRDKQTVFPAIFTIFGRALFYAYQDGKSVAFSYPFVSASISRTNA